MSASYWHDVDEPVSWFRICAPRRREFDSADTKFVSDALGCLEGQHTVICVIKRAADDTPSHSRQSSPRMIRFMNESNIGTVKAVSP